MESFQNGLRRILIGIGAVAWGLAMASQAMPADDTVTAVDLTAISLDDLSAQLDAAPRGRYASEKEGTAGYESILCEIIRRGGIAAEKVLSTRLFEQDDKRRAVREVIKSLEAGSDEANKQERLLDELSNNLELVTALCRVRKQRDPLAVIVDRPGRLKAGTRKPPVLKVFLKNVDAERREIGFQRGGDYRSGRHARWRIHVWDSKGNLLPELPSPSFIGGGMTEDAALAFGKEWEAHLPLASYVTMQTPGKYKVQVLYHDSVTIANFDNPKDLEGLIVFRSEPFEVNVEHGPKISIRLKASSMEKATSLSASLDENDPLRIVIGKYDAKSHDFISPESPQGQLLTMKWQAVPALLKALEDEKLSFRKRAWILSLLFSITLEGDLNPMEPAELFPSRGLLPDYETRGSMVTSVTWKGGFSRGWTQDGKKSAGQENEAEQRALSKQWLRFRDDYIDVRFLK